uniref:G_PROTEIN_RECEP_F1_2 domain-containing protein n=1 Tax=Angiostrongylus costaricensis TaxID=334426 RepID=A0A158PKH0_ANGCS
LFSSVDIILYPPNCEPIPLYASLERLRYVGIIDSFNFTGCLPQCGICDHSLSESDYVTYNLIVSGVILPLIGLFGLVGNGLSAFIFSRAEMRSSTNLYLCALGCSDSAVILTGIFLFFLDSVRKFSLNLTRIFGLFSPIVFPMGMTAQTCSVYFTIFAAADCFAKVCLPENVKNSVAKSKFIRRCIVFVFIFSVLYNIPHCFEAIVIDCFHETLGGSSWEVCPETMRYNELYQEVYYKYMYAIFLAVGPLIILVILNTFIIGKFTFILFILYKFESTILVVLLFIACNAAALLLNTFEAKIVEAIGPYINYIVDLSNLLVVFNSRYWKPLISTMFGEKCSRDRRNLPHLSFAWFSRAAGQ